jgi:hypothetical protein
VILNKVKVKCTRVQALRLCTGRTDHRGSRSMALPFMIMALEGVRGQCHPPAAFYPRERPGTHCTEGCVGPRAGLDRRGISRPTGVRSPDRPARSSVAIPTELPSPHLSIYLCLNMVLVFILVVHPVPSLYLHHSAREPHTCFVL